MPIAMEIVVDRQVLAWISIVGVVFDLLGGEHGPLRTLSRAVTYGMYFGFVHHLPQTTVCIGCRHKGLFR